MKNQRRNEINITDKPPNNVLLMVNEMVLMRSDNCLANVDKVMKFACFR